MLGFLLVDKPKGCTSHDAIYGVRRALGIKKVGHSGTLDPAATGLLIVAVGPATRLLRYLDDEPKVYEGEIVLGIETNTQDDDGEVVATVNASAVKKGAIGAAAKELTGPIEQTPPMFSAIKVGGKALYKLAREGIEIERQPRSVVVHHFSVLTRVGDSIPFEVSCSGGTYVRTLVHDLGQRLGVGAHLRNLRRVSMGDYDVLSATGPNDVATANLIPPEAMLRSIPQVRLGAADVEGLRAGRRLSIQVETAGDLVSCVGEAGLVGLARREGADWQPETVIG